MEPRLCLIVLNDINHFVSFRTFCFYRKLLFDDRPKVDKFEFDKVIKVKKTNKNTSTGMALGMCFGVSIGTSIGSSFGNIAMGSSMGMLFGMVIGLLIGAAKDKEINNQIEEKGYTI